MRHSRSTKTAHATIRSSRTDHARGSLQCHRRQRRRESYRRRHGAAHADQTRHFRPKNPRQLKKIKAASEISFEPQAGLRIGALAAIYDIEASPLVRQHYPVLAEACHVVANIRIRNMATLGGNVAHGDYQSDPPTVLVAL